MIRFATYNDVPALKYIRKVCFDEDEAFLDLYFSKKFTENNTLVYLVDDKPVASLTLLDAEMLLPERTLPVTYVYAVATLPEFRRKGVAEALSLYADKVVQDRGGKASFLVPASEALFAYYAKLGYSTKVYVAQEDYDAMRLLAEDVGVEELQPGNQSVLKFCIRLEGELFGLIKCYAKA